MSDGTSEFWTGRAKRRADGQEGPSPYQRIIRNAKAGRGVRLDAAETWDLAHDDAIETAAYNDDESDAALKEGREPCLG